MSMVPFAGQCAEAGNPREGIARIWVGGPPHHIGKPLLKDSVHLGAAEATGVFISYVNSSTLFQSGE